MKKFLFTFALLGAFASLTVFAEKAAPKAENAVASASCCPAPAATVAKVEAPKAAASGCPVMVAQAENKAPAMCATTAVAKGCADKASAGASCCAGQSEATLAAMAAACASCEDCSKDASKCADCTKCVQATVVQSPSPEAPTATKG